MLIIPAAPRGLCSPYVPLASDSRLVDPVGAGGKIASFPYSTKGCSRACETARLNGRTNFEREQASDIE